MAYHHGVQVLEINEGPRPIRTIETAVAGIVSTAPDADPTVFPYDIPVLLTDVRAAIGKAGDTGLLASTLDSIADQASPFTVVVRVQPGQTEAETTAAVIGTTTPQGRLTGLQALLSAKARFGFHPRILACPGLDTPGVTAEMVAIAQKVRGFAYASAWGCETKEEVVAYRDSYGARELMLIWPDGQKIGSEGLPIVTPAVAAAVGLRAKIDNEIGWHKTLSNVPINGWTGISKDVYWDLQNSATDAGYLNQNEVTTLIREKGFRFWGSRTCSADPLFAFESATRSAQVLADTMADAHFWAVDAPMSQALVRDIIEGINAKLRQMVSLGYLIGAECWYDPDPNTVQSLQSGSLFIDYDFTPVPPMELLTLRQRITGRHLINFNSLK